MLDTTMATTFVPGTNLRGEAAGGNWIYILPSLEINKTICVGVPTSKTLKTLQKISHSIVILCEGEKNLEKTKKVIEQNEFLDVQVILIGQENRIPLMEKCADLVLMAGFWSSRRLSQEHISLTNLRQLLTSRGFLYFEFVGQPDQLPQELKIPGLNDVNGKANILWLTPLRDEMQTAIPYTDHNTINYFLRHKLYAPSVEIPLLDRVERFIDRYVILGRFFRRYGVLLGNGTAFNSADLPKYLQSIAKESGIDIIDHRWGLSARGKSNSRKVLFLLFNPVNGNPEFIVKLTRDKELNYRLVNEYRALNILAEMESGDRETVPQPVFFGCHGDLAILGETMIEGVSFRRQTSYAADCKLGQVAIDWLIELSATSAHLNRSNATYAIEVLNKLLDRFANVYHPKPELYSFLFKQIESIGNITGEFPVVFQHGDPGTWNLLVTKKDGVAFLDWEAAEPEGMPLWDLFYFMRSYAVGSARTLGIRKSLDGFAKQFIAESPLSPWIIEATQRYCDRTNLQEKLVEPLFYTCWMHRALKETTRLTPSNLDRGHYLSLLKLCIEKRNSPTFRQLFSLA